MASQNNHVAVDRQYELSSKQNAEMIEHTKQLMKLAVELNIESVKVGGIEIKTKNEGSLFVPKVDYPLPKELGQTDAVAADEELLYYSSEV